MTLRSDHVAGGIFIGIGILIIALSGDLPFGRLSMPGAGFMPVIVAVLVMIFGLSLVLRGAESKAFAEIDWHDAGHALPVLGIAVIAVALYLTLGYVITMAAMMIALLVGIERKNPLRAGIYSLGVVGCTYLIFTHVLQAPLPGGVLGY